MAFKVRKSSNKNPPILSHEFVIQNHADIFSCIALLFVIGLMVQATSPLAYMFIALHHNLQNGMPMDIPFRYTYGPKDICVVFFYFLICIVMHAIIQEYILDKVSRKLHLSKVKHSKFNESGQLLVFYFMSVLWGGDIIRKENMLLNISSLWEGYPHTEMVFMFKFFYIIQLSYWLHCYPELYFQKTKREEMPARISYSTLGVVSVAAAYLLNFNRVGVCLLVLHYFSEAVHHVARLIDFVDKEEKGSKFGYIISHIAFVLARLGSIMLSVLTFWYGLAVSDTGSGLDWRVGNFNTPTIRLTALAAVCFLQAYLMFNFITEQVRQLREQAPAQSVRTLYASPLQFFFFTAKRPNSQEYDELTEVDQNTKKSLRQRTQKAK
ncbi:hypothetical protein AAG570_002300 [Ranatra chinensis]|uniref:Translocating chain-associated membrane protein n=1 Tax=Ranatra chinensis TaxID=642074 RepID=A0ABD0Y749_9HEMI